MLVKAVILVGGPEKGTRFRPLSLDTPKPLFPVGGVPMIQHHIEACCLIPELKEILLVGYFQPSEQWTQFVITQAKQNNVVIRYLQEFTALGTAGCIYHFRDQILHGKPDSILLLNGDVCADFQLSKMLAFHRSQDRAILTIMGTEALRSQSTEYGCIVENKQTHQVKHYVEKPEGYVSSLVNCGVYVLSPEVFNIILTIMRTKTCSDGAGDFSDFSEVSGFRGLARQNSFTGVSLSETLSLEKDLITQLSITGGAYVYYTEGWWSQIKTAGAAIYANRHCLNLYHNTYPNRLADSEKDVGGPQIIGDVFIHETAKVHPTATLGPNVSIHAHVIIGPGTRVRDSIVLNDVTIAENSCVLNSILGWGSHIGSWSRIEGTPNDPNPDKAFAKLEHMPLFSESGFLNPSVTILGAKVNVPSELMVLNSIVLPHKDLAHSYKNQIIL